MIQDNEYMVTVCITTYNMEKYIVRSLESVLMQETSFPFQIIVSDDASSDNTINIVEGFQRKFGDKIILLKSAKNKGLIENIVNAFKVADGKYIATLDADDYWIDPLKLQKQVDILEQKNEIGFVYTNYYTEVETTGKRTVGYSNSHKFPEKDAFFQMLICPFVNMSIPCFRRSLLNTEEMNDFVRLKFQSPDAAFFSGFVTRTKGLFLPDITTVYVIREGSMSHQVSFEKRIISYKRCFEIGEYYRGKTPVPDEIILKMNFNLHLTLLLVAWENQDFEIVKAYVQPLKAMDFIRHNKKALYIYYASKNKALFNLFKPWVLRKRD